jgi:hypothetical protein
LTNWRLLVGSQNLGAVALGCEMSDMHCFDLVCCSLEPGCGSSGSFDRGIGYWNSHIHDQQPFARSEVGRV